MSLGHVYARESLISDVIKGSKDSTSTTVLGAVSAEEDLNRAFLPDRLRSDSNGVFKAARLRGEPDLQADKSEQTAGNAPSDPTGGDAGASSSRVIPNDRSDDNKLKQDAMLNHELEMLLTQSESEGDVEIERLEGPLKDNQNNIRSPSTDINSGSPDAVEQKSKTESESGAVEVHEEGSKTSLGTQSNTVDDGVHDDDPSNPPDNREIASDSELENKSCTDSLQTARSSTSDRGSPDPVAGDAVATDMLEAQISSKNSQNSADTPLNALLKHNPIQPDPSSLLAEQKISQAQVDGGDSAKGTSIAEPKESPTTANETLSTDNEEDLKFQPENGDDTMMGIDHVLEPNKHDEPVPPGKENPRSVSQDAGPAFSGLSRKPSYGQAAEATVSIANADISQKPTAAASLTDMPFGSITEDDAAKGPHEPAEIGPNNSGHSRESNGQPNTTRLVDGRDKDPSLMTNRQDGKMHSLQDSSQPRPIHDLQEGFAETGSSTSLSPSLRPVPQPRNRGLDWSFDLDNPPPLGPDIF